MHSILNTVNDCLWGSEGHKVKLLYTFQTDIEILYPVELLRGQLIDKQLLLCS